MTEDSNNFKRPFGINLDVYGRARVCVCKVHLTEPVAEKNTKCIEPQGTLVLRIYWCILRGRRTPLDGTWIPLKSPLSQLPGCATQCVPWPKWSHHISGTVDNFPLLGPWLTSCHARTVTVISLPFCVLQPCPRRPRKLKPRVWYTSFDPGDQRPWPLGPFFRHHKLFF
jgi:hypothetical protein